MLGAWILGACIVCSSHGGSVAINSEFWFCLYLLFFLDLLVFCVFGFGVVGIPKGSHWHGLLKELWLTLGIFAV